MKIQNSNKFIATAIDIFNKKSIAINKPKDFNTPRFDPGRFYSSGHCAEYACCLANFAHDNGIKADITIMYSNVKCPESNDVLDKTFSHCVIEHKDESFDVSGDKARNNWFFKHDYIYQDEDNVEREWEFLTISFSDPKSVYDELKNHCDKQGVDFSSEQIDKDNLIFKSIIDNENDIELVSNM
jgi:hypothetical protein